MSTRTPIPDPESSPTTTLKGKQRMFVEAYLACWNASEAARRAGYSIRTAGQIGYELLKKPEIQAAIADRITEVTMGADEVLARLSRQARGTMEDLLYIGEEEITLNSYIINEPVPDEELEPGELEAISSDRMPRRNRTIYRVETVRRQVARIDLHQAAQRGMLDLVKKYSLTQQGVSVEIYNAQEALALLAKHHGLLVERHEHSGPAGGPIPVDSAVQAQAAEELAAWRASQTEALRGLNASLTPVISPTPTD